MSFSLKWLWTSLQLETHLCKSRTENNECALRTFNKYLLNEWPTDVNIFFSVILMTTMTLSKARGYVLHRELVEFINIPEVVQGIGISKSMVRAIQFLKMQIFYLKRQSVEIASLCSRTQLWCPSYFHTFFSHKKRS